MMVTVNTGNGNRRSSVYFLLALVLKHALKIIKDSTGGERMNEFEVEFEGFSANEILKSNFVKAGELINVEIVFGSK
uniref:Uncharacterized protein n=1 Tax=Panagrolaimus superbus TaxID=310955 RepID=A0A914ZAW1_9BILA